MLHLSISEETSFILLPSGEKDYGSIYTQVIFLPGGPTLLCIDIHILPDADQEGTEVFIVELDYLEDCGEKKFDSTTVQITDSCSETMDINFVHTEYSVDEGAGAVSVCVLMSGETMKKHVRIYTATLGTTSRYALGNSELPYVNLFSVH